VHGSVRNEHDKPPTRQGGRLQGADTSLRHEARVTTKAADDVEAAEAGQALSLTSSRSISA
jgi:hypothetical protein